MKTLLLVGLASIALASPPASAGTIGNDFNSENGGVAAANYTGFVDIGVQGHVDLLETGNPAGIVCSGGSGGCVDLMGTGGPGTVFATLPGQPGIYAVLISFELAADPRATSTQTFFFGLNLAGNPKTGISFSVDPGQGFLRYGLVADFVRGAALNWQGFVGTEDTSGYGPILDNFSFGVEGSNCCPEPGQLALFGLATLGVGFGRRRAR